MTKELREALESARQVASDAIDHVAVANWPGRDAEAMEQMDKAFDKLAVVLGRYVRRRRK